MDQNEAPITVESHTMSSGRRGERGTTATKSIRGLSTTTLRHLERLWGLGLSYGDAINAAMDLLMLDLTKNGELCGDYRIKDNFIEQIGPVEDPDAGQIVLRMKRYLQWKKQFDDLILNELQDHLAEVREKELSPKTGLTGKSSRQARTRSRDSQRQRSEIVPPLPGRHKSG